MPADIRDYGAVAGSGGVAATTAAINAALASGLSVLIPSDFDWYSNGGHWCDRNAIVIDGQGGARLTIAAGSDIGFITGFKRQPRGLALTQAHLPSGNAVLDSSAQGHYGWAFLGDAHISQQLGSVTGDPTRWAGRYFVADFALDNAAAVSSATESCWGWGDGLPVACFSRPNGPDIRFRLSDGIQREFSIPTATQGFHRFSLFIDAQAGIVRCWLDRVQVAPGGGWVDLATSAGRTMFGLGGSSCPFQVGYLAGDTVGGGTFEYGDAASHGIIYGLRLGTAPLYNDSGIGQPQTFRSDSGSDLTLNDNNQFFTQRTGSRAWALLTDTPATVAANRLVSFGGADYPGGVTSFNSGLGLFLSNGYVATVDTLTGLTIRDLTITMTSPYGSPMIQGALVGHTLRDCTLVGGSAGFLGYDVDTDSFYTRFLRGVYGGSWHAIRHAAGQCVIDGSELTQGAPAVSNLELFRTTAVVPFVRIGSGTPKNAIHGSGIFNGGHIELDFEDGVYPSHAALDWAALSIGQPQPNLLRWDYFVTGNQGAGSYLISLHDDPGHDAHVSEIVPGPVCNGGAPLAAVIQCDGSSWYGVIPAAFVGAPGIPSLLFNGAGTNHLSLGSGSGPPVGGYGMDYRPGASFHRNFTVADPSTGAARDADGGAVTAIAVRNGTADGTFTLTVTHLATGRYHATGTVPSGYAVGDVVDIDITAAVGGVAVAGTIASFIVGPMPELTSIKGQTDKLPFDTAGNVKSAAQTLPTPAPSGYGGGAGGAAVKIPSGLVGAGSTTTSVVVPQATSTLAAFANQYRNRSIYLSLKSGGQFFNVIGKITADSFDGVSHTFNLASPLPFAPAGDGTEEVKIGA
jgi:hypothetical protein